MRSRAVPALAQLLAQFVRSESAATQVPSTSRKPTRTSRSGSDGPRAARRASRLSRGV